jgi:hypothetical protein
MWCASMNNHAAHDSHLNLDAIKKRKTKNSPHLQIERILKAKQTDIFKLSIKANVLLIFSQTSREVV